MKNRVRELRIALCVLFSMAASAGLKMKTTITDPNALREEVRSTYGKIALHPQDGCGTAGSSACCGPARPAATAAEKLGYSTDEIAALPAGADLGLGCGNPQAIASLKPGEAVLDLGSGAGFD